MSIFDTAHQRAAWLVAILGIIVIIALAPYASGLLAAPVLYVVFRPMHTWLVSRLQYRGLASGIIIMVALFTIVLPLVWMVSLLLGQAQDAANAIIASPILQRLDNLRIANYAVGPQLKDAGSKLISLLGGGALVLVSTAARMTLNLVLSSFGLYYILIDPPKAWNTVRPFIPFSDENVEYLRVRFGDITSSTIIGTDLATVCPGASADHLDWGAWRCRLSWHHRPVHRAARVDVFLRTGGDVQEGVPGQWSVDISSSGHCCWGYP